MKEVPAWPTLNHPAETSWESRFNTVHPIRRRAYTVKLTVPAP